MNNDANSALFSKLEVVAEAALLHEALGKRGAMTSMHINNFWKDFENPQNLGFFIGAWNIGSVMPLPEFHRRMETLIQELKACPPAPSHTEVFYPGEIEHRRSRRMKWP
jgi:LDH2 family malate/lactate/ureidoglycolate dehydrogenase